MINVLLFLPRVLGSIGIIVLEVLFILINFIGCFFIIIIWLFSGSSVKNNSNNGKFHRLYFSTTYRGQKWLKKLWKIN